MLCVFLHAQILFYPTAIGSEPQDANLNSYPHWTRVMCGHAGANLVTRARLLAPPLPTLLMRRVSVPPRLSGADEEGQRLFCSAPAQTSAHFLWRSAKGRSWHALLQDFA